MKHKDITLLRQGLKRRQDNYSYYSTLNKITRFWLVERSTIIALIVLRTEILLSEL